MNRSQVRDIAKRNEAALLALDGVVSVGTGWKISNGKKLKERCIIVGVEKKLSKIELNVAEVIPKSLSGAKTDVVQIGKQRIFTKTGNKKIQGNWPGFSKRIFENTSYERPAIGGCSIGHKDITAGTFGCVVKDVEGQEYILSNNHVMANSNAAKIGDPILQPGPYDGGEADDDVIATLHSFVPVVMQEGGSLPDLPDLPSECEIAGLVADIANLCAKHLDKATRLKAVKPNPKSLWGYSKTDTPKTDNLVDAALAKPISEDMIDDDLIDMDHPTEIAEVDLDSYVQKSGRTTGYTEDMILQTDATVDVQYGEGQVARFTDQLIAGPMSAGGDSGSAVLDADGKLIGLLFAGSEEVTIINRIQNVFALLDVSL